MRQQRQGGHQSSPLMPLPRHVLVVTEDNFKAELRKGPMLLEFYTPVRCGAVA
jgi:hypothetical protein